MNQYLPHSKFTWLSEDEYKSINWSKTDEESDIGYILEVDLKYPKNLHEFHKDYPLAPQKFKIFNNKLSSYQTKTLNLM